MASCRRAGEPTLARVCAHLVELGRGVEEEGEGELRAFGKGALLLSAPALGAPSGWRQGCSLLCSCPARAWGGACLGSLACLVAAAEHKALSPCRSLFPAEPDPPKRRICT